MLKCSMPKLLMYLRNVGRNIEMMLDCGYIKGVTAKTYVNGCTVVDCQNIQITRKGLEYLQENSMMQKIYKTMKGIKDVVPAI